MASNGGIVSQLQSARLVAAVAELGSLGHTVRRKLTIAFLALIACGLALPVYYYLVDRTDHSLTWGARLRDRLEHCDEIVISSGSPYEDKADRRFLFRSTDRGVITNLVSSIRTHDASSGVHCGCSGDPTLEFYHGWHKLATVGVHHGQLLRWDDGWDGDGVLTPEASKEFVALLKQHGLSDEDLR
jgi:hypothetical protein